MWKEVYVSITIVQSYTGKYHEFVAVGIVTSVQRKQQCQWQQVQHSLVYGDNFIFDFIACSNAACVTSLQYLVWVLAWLPYIYMS